LFFPLPWIILIPYWLIRGLLNLIGNRKYSERDKHVLKWLAKPDDPMSPQDYQNKRVVKIDTAIKKGQPVNLQYAGTDGFTSRVVRPERLFRRGKNIYMEAYCFKRKEYRCFRVDRIKYLQ